MQTARRLFFPSLTRSTICHIRNSYALATRQYSELLCPSSGSAKGISQIRRKKKDLDVEEPSNESAKSISESGRKEKDLKVDEPQKLVEFLLQHGLPRVQVARVVQSLQTKRMPKVHSEKIICLIRFLQSSDMAADKIAGLLLRATFLFLRDLDTHILPKFQILESLGLERRELCMLLLRYPYFLYGEAEDLQAQIDFLKGFRLDNEALCSIIKKNPSLLRLRTEKYLQPRIEFIKSLGIDNGVVRTLLLTSPRIFSRSTQKIHRAVDLLEELGFKKGTDVFSRAFGRVARHNSDSIKLAVKNLVKLGFSQDQVERIFQKVPPLFGRGIDDISKKVTYLVEVMKRPLTDALKYPVFFLISLERRIVPRHEALVKWKAENQVEKEYSLSYMYASSNEKFCKRFRSSIQS